MKFEVLLLLHVMTQRTKLDHEHEKMKRKAETGETEVQRGGVLKN
jgi:hypothetical protein